MNEAQAIKEIRSLFAEYGIEISEHQAQTLIEIGLRHKVCDAIRLAGAAATHA